MTKIPSEQQVSQMFNNISSTYDRTNRVLSLGIDQLWRKKLKNHLPKGTNLSLIDLATGTCDQLLALMNTNKFIYGIGIDLAEDMLKLGSQKIAKSPFSKHLELKFASALEVPVESGSFDCATISFGIRNVSDTSGCLKEMRRVLKSGGTALILEFSIPNNRLIRALHLFYLRKILPKLGNLLSGEKDAYSYLNRTIEAFPYGDSFIRLMKQAGFAEAKAYPLTFGIATIYVGKTL